MGAGPRRGRDTDPEGYAGCCEAIRDMDLRDRLPSIARRARVGSPGRLRRRSRASGRFISDAILEARFEVISNAADLANVEQPAEITRAVLDHLSPTTARRTD